MEIFVIARGRELEHQLLRLKMERKQGRRINIVTAQWTAERGEMMVELRTTFAAHVINYNYLD